MPGGQNIYPVYEAISLPTVLIFMSGTLHQVNWGISVCMCMCVGDFKQFNMTSPPKQVDRHHTHTHNNAHRTMCVAM